MGSNPRQPIRRGYELVGNPGGRLVETILAGFDFERFVIWFCRLLPYTVVLALACGEPVEQTKKTAVKNQLLNHQVVVVITTMIPPSTIRRETPDSIPPIMVAPERDVPGIIATLRQTDSNRLFPTNGFYLVGRRCSGPTLHPENNHTAHNECARNNLRAE
jgi:hypothetical protein